MCGWGRGILESIGLRAGTGMDGRVVELKAWNEKERIGGNQKARESQIKP